MPYIPLIRAQALNAGQVQPQKLTAGDLTYLLSRECAQYLEARGVKFQTLAEVSAALRSTALEIERRVQAPYEDEKRRQFESVDPFAALPGFRRQANL